RVGRASLTSLPARRASDLGTALDVPSRASAAEAAVPRGFPGAFDTPQEGVERIPFAWSIRVSPTLREDRAHRLAVIVRLVAESRSEEHTSELQSRENLVCR